MYSDSVRRLAALAVRGLLALPLLALTGCESSAPPAAASSFVEAGGAFPVDWPFPTDTPPVTARGGMVATTDEYASRVGLDILAAGGNAVDHREKAPMAATRDMYLDDAGNVTDRSVVGHLSAGVPGSVAGLWEAHRRFGVLEWGDVVEPAIRLARGFEVTVHLVSTLDAAQDRIRAFPASARVFLPGGSVPAIGDTFEQADLAGVLTRLRDEGPDDFYRGETGRLIAAEMERGDGIMTMEDLDRYEAVWRDPVSFDYRSHTVHSMPPPSSGGVTMAAIANMVERWDLAALGWNSTDAVHVMAESFRRAATISVDRATPSSEVRPGLETVLDESHSTHYSLVDGDGNAVAVTTSINSWYGGKVVVDGAGFFLSNTMDDFAAKPGTANQFGLVQGERNAVAAEKCMLSAMSPTIVEDAGGALFLVTGTPGGATIITTVLQTIFNVIDHGMNAVQAVHAPRVHHQHLPDQVFFEHRGLAESTVETLRDRGHTVQGREPGPPDAYFTGGMAGWSDPRRGGLAVGYREQGPAPSVSLLGTVSTRSTGFPPGNESARSTESGHMYAGGTSTGARNSTTMTDPARILPGTTVTAATRPAEARRMAWASASSTTSASTTVPSTGLS